MRVEQKLVNVKMSEIKEDFNPRSDFSSVDEIAKSIESVGLLQPIVVRELGNKGDKKEMLYSIVDGACRFRALKKLGQKETQVVVVSAESAEEGQMAANLMRSNLNVLERARGYERMVRLFPAKYNAAGLSKIFGDPKSSVERLISVAKRIPANFDGKLSPMMQHLGFEDLEQLAQVPNNGTMDKVIEALSEKDSHRNMVYMALNKACKALDYSVDALTTGKLVAAGRAFVIKNQHRQESAYTTDLAAYKEAKEAYEKKQGKTYGAAEKDHKEKVKAKSEKQVAVERAARKKEKESRLKAVAELAPLFKKYVKDLATEKDVDELGREACERHLDSDKCRRLWAAFGIKGCSDVSSYDLRSKTWEKVFAPIVKTGQQVARLRTFLTLGWKDGKTPEQAWVDGMKK